MLCYIRLFRTRQYSIFFSEDLCRDLVVNNDHIHVVEQRMRVAIEKVDKTNTHAHLNTYSY